MYYFRTRAAADAIKFTVDQLSLAKNKGKAGAALVAPAPPGAKVAPSPAKKKAAVAAAAGEDDRRGVDDRMMEREAQLAAMVCSLENKDACLMCGS